MQCPYCEKKLNDDWNNRTEFLKHTATCLDDHLNKNTSPPEIKEKLDLGYTLASPGWDKFYTFNTDGLAEIFKLNTSLDFLKDLQEMFDSDNCPYLPILLEALEEYKRRVQTKIIIKSLFFEITALGSDVQRKLLEKEHLEPFLFCKIDEGHLFMYHPFVRFVYRQRHGLTKELYKKLEVFPMFEIEKINEKK